MAIPDGKPATDFSAMNREWVRAVAEEAAESGGGGIPAPESPSNGDVLTYSSTDSAWVAAAPGGGGGGIPAPESPSNGDVLTYSSTDSAWVAAAPGGGGGGGSMGILLTPVPDDPDDNIIMDKTWNEIKSAIEDDCFVYAYFKDDESGDLTEWNIYYPRTLSSAPNEYSVVLNTDETYATSSADGYPVTDYGGGG